MSQTPFDLAAPEYDSRFTETPAGKAQRDMVWRFLHKQLPPSPANILEINCGTGEDAVHLATAGFHVTATDASENMLAEAGKKFASVRMNVHSYVWDVRTPFIGTEKFNVIFSNFGGLNCLSPSELRSLFKRMQSQLSENGKLIIVVMGRNCPWERLLFSLKGNFKQAKRRKSKNAVIAKTGGENSLPVWYYSIEEIVEFAGDNFNLVFSRPIGLCIPPVYGKKAFWHNTMLIALLRNIETAIGGLKLFRNSGDHLFITLQKNEADQ
ncbi:MAG TPA: class I SAM-dependent methyltransferase [Chitinophagales bacterium]|nr:methyltransferase domain-containing protein [Chitinophagales bacterium]HMX05326.1 class I SAM-dependent methyltransferase [Chitinophagales bacterium]HNA56542.1 class I SAM-dependent methyltransferase [Chitinophagales bacterium]HNE45103.1 class I SAM-dependent methyltransferase [Chitinophagales bacterium]HNF68557.1 class I SAM-dependent methyltransferase [Chitinophagales bacterium]